MLQCRKVARSQGRGWNDGPLALGFGVASLERGYDKQPVYRVGGTQLAMHVDLPWLRVGRCVGRPFGDRFGRRFGRYIAGCCKSQQRTAAIAEL